MSIVLELLSRCVVVPFTGDILVVTEFVVESNFACDVPAVVWNWNERVTVRPPRVDGVHEIKPVAVAKVQDLSSPAKIERTKPLPMKPPNTPPPMNPSPNPGPFPRPPKMERSRRGQPIVIASELREFPEPRLLGRQHGCC